MVAVGGEKEAPVRLVLERERDLQNEREGNNREREKTQ